MAALLGALLWMNKVEEDKKSAELQELNKKLYQEEQEKQATLKQKEVEDSFYQKLVDGFDVNVLIVGDSIAENGQGEKGWCTLLQNNLRKTYNNRVSFTNVSMGGNASYAGYVRTMLGRKSTLRQLRLSLTITWLLLPERWQRLM